MEVEWSATYGDYNTFPLSSGVQVLPLPCWPCGQFGFIEVTWGHWTESSICQAKCLLTVLLAAKIAIDRENYKQHKEEHSWAFPAIKVIWRHLCCRSHKVEFNLEQISFLIKSLQYLEYNTNSALSFMAEYNLSPLKYPSHLLFPPLEHCTVATLLSFNYVQIFKLILTQNSYTSVPLPGCSFSKYFCFHFTYYNVRLLRLFVYFPAVSLLLCLHKHCQSSPH